MNLRKFFAELKRRNVYRAAVAYGMVAWLLTQVATQVFPFFEIPNSTVRFIVIALVLGFPIAMALSWLYELTPEGFVREENVDPKVRRSAGRRLDFAIIGVLLLVIVMLVYERLPFRSSTGEPIPEKSIAVLPFANFSEDKENAFFADGIQDDILTSLAKIRALRVISRSSVMQFRDPAAHGLREVAKTLGVANVLEGSVRRQGDRVVVNVQLIDALKDRHLWANRYERTLADSLGLQGELAAEIAEALRVTLSPDEKARVQTKPTGNTDAYVVYLRANQIQRNPDTLLEDYKTGSGFTGRQLHLIRILRSPMRGLPPPAQQFSIFMSRSRAGKIKHTPKPNLRSSCSQIWRKHISPSVSTYTGLRETMIARCKNLTRHYISRLTMLKSES